MADIASSLNAGLLRQLQSDGLMAIGHFHIEVPTFHYDVETPAALERPFSVYAWVSVANQGSVLRIGKCEGPLRTRLSAYKRSLDLAMSGRLAPNEYFKGDTQPWEVEGWIRLAGGTDGGLIFAKSLAGETIGSAAREALACFEARLIARYDPPLCGVSPSGQRAKRNWETQHGATSAISARRSSLDKPRSPAG